jgi:hypothetical protein
MDASSLALLTLLAVLVLANLVVSFQVARSHFYSSTQKFAQCAIVWFIPVLGVVGIWAFLRAQYRWEKYDTRAYPEHSQKMVAVEISNAVLDSFGDGGAHGGGD